MKTDVVIVGKGIAALVLSYLLTKKGIDHLILEREASAKQFALAETLPPSSLPLLQSLGLLSLFEANSIRKTYGYHSCWGNAKLVDNNFYFQQPFKYGLKIDKGRILSALEKMSTAPVLQYAHQLQLASTAEGHRLSFGKKGHVKNVDTQFIIDATGRNRAVLKLLNIKTVHYDQGLSFSCHLPRKTHPKIKHDVFVESFTDGWGLVSGLNESEIVLSLFTQRDSTIHGKITNYVNWADLLHETKYLKFFLAKNDSFKVKGGMSNSSKPAQLAGNNWLAIGDAALAFDPLSSHGISNALYTAREVAGVLGDAVERAGVHLPIGTVVPNGRQALRLNGLDKHHNRLQLEGKVSQPLPSGIEAAMLNYERGLNEVFVAYLAGRNRLYNQLQQPQKVMV